MDQSSQEIIERLLGECAQALLECYGVSLAPTGSFEGALGVATVVGFSSATARGSVVLLTSDAVVEQTKPFEDTDPDDWLGELGNQFIGRMKTAMLGYGVEFNINIPTTMHGDRLRFSWGLRAAKFAADLEGDGLGARALMGVLLDGDPWQLVKQEDTEIAEAGDLLLF